MVATSCSPVAYIDRAVWISAGWAWKARCWSRARRRVAWLGRYFGASSELAYDDGYAATDTCGEGDGMGFGDRIARKRGKLGKQTDLTRFGAPPPRVTIPGATPPTVPMKEPVVFTDDEDQDEPL